MYFLPCERNITTKKKPAVFAHVIQVKACLHQICFGERMKKLSNVGTFECLFLPVYKQNSSDVNVIGLTNLSRHLCVRLVYLKKKELVTQFYGIKASLKIN